MEKKKKLSVIGLAGLLVVALIAGTLAFWNSTSSIENPFDTGKYGTTINEFFDPSDGEDWQPGVEVDKNVYVENTGNQDVIVRVKLEESWTRKGETTPYKDSSPAGGHDVYTVNQANATDGLTDADDSVVTKYLENIYDGTDGSWVKGGDGWYYYISNLKEGETTDRWLKSVELINDADMGAFATTYYVTHDAAYAADKDNPSADSALDWYAYHVDTSAAAKPAVPVYFAPVSADPADGADFYYSEAEVIADGKTLADVEVVNRNKADTTYALDASDNPLYGYSNSDYVLTVTSQTVQATEEAVDAVFGGGSTFVIPTGCDWELK